MTPIAPNEEYIMQLGKLVKPAETLAKNGYITRPLTYKQLFLKQRCGGCGKTMHKLPKEPPLQPYAANDALARITPSQLTMQEVETVTKGQQNLAEAGVSEPPTFRCKYHPGQVVKNVWTWTCCGQGTLSAPCGGAAMHIFRNKPMSALIQDYQFYSTPPSLRMQRNARIAVAIDCEMGTAVSGDPEPIRVTLIDYFSGEILVDNIVYPDVPMQSLHTRYSGVSWQDLNKAKRERTSLRGHAGARRALWKYIGLDTIVVGHGAHNDLRALRWIHGSVVDSFIIESKRRKREELKRSEERRIVEQNCVHHEGNEGGLGTSPSSKLANENTRPSEANAPKATVEPRRGQLSLKNLAKRRLGRDIQMGGMSGHDSLEDAVAARDLVHWNISNPDEGGSAIGNMMFTIRCRSRIETI